ncbi:hypothetical protein Scep_021136 [Stephania cephalantha]|uniref:Small ribosomal subunit protein mS38 n=1 Tax=Stephania cephalantha TaxID=152367 RepID=A0AAP0HZZ8_9MAGN
MAHALRELAKKPSTLRTIATTLTNQTQQPNLIATSLFSLKPIFNELFQAHPCEQKPIFASQITDTIDSSNGTLIYPNFPFGYCLNPIISTGSDPFEEIVGGGSGSDEAGTIWADSVKKKRKKKMNKHKYRKLRKRLRNKS